MMGCGASSTKNAGEGEVPGSAPAKSAAQPAKRPTSCTSRTDLPVDFLKKVFTQFDEDGSGTIEKPELAMALKALGITGTYDAVWDTLDGNQDGVISLEEMETNLPQELRVAIIAKLDSDGMIQGWKQAVTLVKLFDQFDQNASGMVSRKELSRALLCLGLGAETESLMGQLDQDEKTEVDVKEWMEGLLPDVKEGIMKHLDERGVLMGVLPTRKEKRRVGSPAETKAGSFDRQAELAAAEKELRAAEAVAGEGDGSAVE